MGYQVIKQPDGRLAVFSSFVDCWAIMDATPDEVVEWFAERAAADARRNAERVVGHVMAGQARKVYYQFTDTFDEANETSAEHGGAVFRDGAWHEQADRDWLAAVDAEISAEMPGDLRHHDEETPDE